MNKILKVFTKEYKEETKNEEFMEKNIDQFKLKSYNHESVDEKVKRLKKLMVYATMFTIGTTTLVGCGENNNSNKKEKSTKKITSSVVKSELNREVKSGDKKVFKPYEHLFFVRFTDEEDFSKAVNGGSVVIPEGYQVFKVENFIEQYSYGSQTGGYDVWYTNTETVEVEAVYNEGFEKYDYSHFGKVIVKENEKSITIEENTLIKNKKY